MSCQSSKKEPNYTIFRPLITEEIGLARLVIAATTCNIRKCTEFVKKIGVKSGNKNCIFYNKIIITAAERLRV
jgi:hypothetical protein